MKNYNIAVIPGDGIGPEVIEEAIKVLKALEHVYGDVSFTFDYYNWNCAYYLEHGCMMPEDGLDCLRGYDTILFGAVGHPEVPDHISVWELILPIRKTFQQYVNLRPIKLLPGIKSVLRDKDCEHIDFMIVRENTEGEYSNSGGVIHPGEKQEVVIQNSVFTRVGTERILKYAYELANKRKKQLTVATKSNAINFAMPFWDEVTKQIGEQYSCIEKKFYHVDALATFFVTYPEKLDVVVASNLFGDILSDLGAGIAGGLGLAPSGNINPEKKYPSMFEAIHGSAPDIAGKGIANPIAQIWSASLMLEHLDLDELSTVIMQAIEHVLIDGNVLTPDLGGDATTQQFGDAIVAHILQHEQV